MWNVFFADLAAYQEAAAELQGGAGGQAQAPPPAPQPAPAAASASAFAALEARLAAAQKKAARERQPP